jgi:hypothetical protein
MTTPLGNRKKGMKERDTAGTGCGGESIKTVFKMGLRLKSSLVVPTRATFANTARVTCAPQTHPATLVSHGES